MFQLLNAAEEGVTMATVFATAATSGSEPVGSKVSVVLSERGAFAADGRRERFKV